MYKVYSRIFIFAFIILILLNIIYQSFCLEEFEETITYSITIYSDGSAFWKIEHRFRLKTKEDELAFYNFTKTYRKEVFLSDFINKTEHIIRKASEITGRNMEAQKYDFRVYNLTLPTISFGILEYSFKWINFAKIEENRIYIGDIFSGGFYLAKNDILEIILPENYNIISLNPEEDKIEGRKLIWYGPRNFESNCPEIILSYFIETTTQIQTSTPTISTATEETFITSKITSGTYTTEETATQVLTSITTTPIEVGGIPTLTILFITLIALSLVASFPIIKRIRSKPTFEDLRADEELIIRLLKEAGGTMSQSDIKKKTGFSKAKTSMVLKSLHQKGLIEKTRRGREQIITLKY
ncbi:MAG: DUF4897 domain-containing protein [Nitrososphaerota archaeon]